MKERPKTRYQWRKTRSAARTGATSPLANSAIWQRNLAAQSGKPRSHLALILTLASLVQPATVPRRRNSPPPHLLPNSRCSDLPATHGNRRGLGWRRSAAHSPNPPRHSPQKQSCGRVTLVSRSRNICVRHLPAPRPFRQDPSAVFLPKPRHVQPLQ